jgi:hypothetical protein
MRRRKLRWVLAGLAVISLALAAMAAMVRPESQHLTKGKYKEIDVGMTRARVHAVLGPPGDYRTGPTTEVTPLASRGQPPECWKSNEGMIWVSYDQSGTVDNYLKNFTRPPEPKPLQNLLWRLKRQWHRWFPE